MKLIVKLSLDSLRSSMGVSGLPLFGWGMVPIKTIKLNVRLVPTKFGGLFVQMVAGKRLDGKVPKKFRNGEKKVSKG